MYLRDPLKVVEAPIGMTIFDIQIEKMTG